MDENEYEDFLAEARRLFEKGVQLDAITLSRLRIANQSALLALPRPTPAMPGRR